MYIYYHTVPLTPYRKVGNYKFLLTHLRNRDPLPGLSLFLPSHNEDQKNRDIQKRTAKKICKVSCNLAKVAVRPVTETTTEASES